jgi:hypothetical protein
MSALTPEALDMRRSIPFAFASLAVLGGCAHPADEDPSLLVDRVWLEGKPQEPREYLHAAYLLPQPKIGVFQRASAYDFHLERFDHERSGKTLKLTFPQTGKKAEITFSITACSTLPPFDLCLDLSENPWGGPKRYYGMREQDDDDASRSALRAQLGARGRR